MLLVTFCANPQQMAKLAALVKTECNPQILECVGGEIKATYTIHFPEKYFVQTAYLKVTPVLVYEGGQVAGPDFWMQGEKIRDNYKAIPYKTASTVSRDVVFAYKPGMEKATLQLVATVYNNSKSKSYEYPIPFKIAEGTNCTYMLAKTNGTVFEMEDTYQKEVTEEVETEILYDVNKADVKNTRLNSKEIKAFEEFIKKAQKDKSKTVNSSKIIGYASPEGPQDKNNTLSNQRAKSAKTAYDKTISKKANLDVPVTIEEKGEDWEGFQKIVKASNIEDKDLILRVLSMYSDPVIREREIRNMSQVFQTLSTKVLPQLRRSRIVTSVTKKNFTDEEIAQMLSNSDENLTEEAMVYYAAKVAKDNDEKIAVLKKAAERFGTTRALNNLAAAYLTAGQTDKAAEALSKIKEESAGYYNNMGVVQMQKGEYDKAAEYFYMAKGENDELIEQAKENIGALLIMDGDYTGALESLNESKGFNHALALVLTGKLDQAKTLLTNADDPDESYLRAIIAARKGEAGNCERELAKAYENGKYEARADNDIEFAALQ